MLTVWLWRLLAMLAGLVFLTLGFFAMTRSAKLNYMHRSTSLDNSYAFRSWIRFFDEECRYLVCNWTAGALFAYAIQYKFGMVELSQRLHLSTITTPVLVAFSVGMFVILAIAYDQGLLSMVRRYARIPEILDLAEYLYDNQVVYLVMQIVIIIQGMCLWSALQFFLP